MARPSPLDKLQTWETLDEQTRVTMGTGVYTTKFKMSKRDNPKANWKIDLGDVRESARVYINGQFIGCAWSVPFVLDTKGTLKAGSNELRIEVTNLPANRIADLDRQGVKWRKMEEINVVDINYKKTLYDQWEPMPSGLNSAVQIFTPLRHRDLSRPPEYLLNKILNKLNKMCQHQHHHHLPPPPHTKPFKRRCHVFSAAAFSLSNIRKLATKWGLSVLLVCSCHHGHASSVVYTLK